MDDERFDRILTEGQGLLAAWMMNAKAHPTGENLAYSVWLDSSEVVAIGYRYTEDGHVWTRPIAILIDEDLFDRMTANESGRRDGEGNLRPPRPPSGG